MTKQLAFIFDMDGTLVDNMHIHTDVWLQLLAEVGVHMEAEQFISQTAGKTNPAILRELIDPDMSDEAVATFADHKEQLYREIYAPLLAPIPGLLPFLDEARARGVPMAVATSAGAENIDFILNGLELRDYFGAIVGAQDVTNGKPHPEIFLTTAVRLGVAPMQCVVFEDSVSGVEAAQRAGMRIVALTTSHEATLFAGWPMVETAVPDFHHLSVHDLIRNGRD